MSPALIIPSHSDVFLHTAAVDTLPVPALQALSSPISPRSFLPQKTSTPSRSTDRKLWANTARRDKKLGMEHQLSGFGGPPQPPSVTHELEPLKLKRVVSSPPTITRPSKRVSSTAAAPPPVEVEAQQRTLALKTAQAQTEEEVCGDVGVRKEQLVDPPKQNSVLARERDPAEGELGDVSDKIAITVDEMRATEARARRLTERLLTTSKDLESAVARYEALETKNIAFEEEIHQLREAKGSLEAKLGDLSAQYERLQHEYDELRDSNEQLELMQQEGYAMAILLLREKDQDIMALEQEVAALQDEIKKVTSCSSSANTATPWTPFSYAGTIGAYSATTEETPLACIERLLSANRKVAEDSLTRIDSGLDVVNPDVDNSLPKSCGEKAPTLICSSTLASNVPAESTTTTIPVPCRDPPAYTSRQSNLDLRTQNPSVSDYPAASSTTISNIDSSVIQDGSLGRVTLVNALADLHADGSEVGILSDETGGAVAMAREANGERDVLVGSNAKAHAGGWRRGKVAISLVILLLVWIVVHRGDIRGPFGQL